MQAFAEPIVDADDLRDEGDCPILHSDPQHGDDVLIHGYQLQGEHRRRCIWEQFHLDYNHHKLVGLEETLGTVGWLNVAIFPPLFLRWTLQTQTGVDSRVSGHATGQEQFKLLPLGVPVPDHNLATASVGVPEIPELNHWQICALVGDILVETLE